MGITYIKSGSASGRLVFCSVFVFFQLVGLYWILSHLHTPFLVSPTRLTLIAMSQLAVDLGVAQHLQISKDRLRYQVALIVGVYVLSLLFLYPLAPSVAGIHVDTALIKHKTESMICIVVLIGFVVINIAHCFKLAKQIKGNRTH